MTRIDVLKTKNIMAQEFTCHSDKKIIQRKTISMMPIDELETKEPEVTLPLVQKKHERKLHYYDLNRIDVLKTKQICT
jgi:hypothetical protein